jgi:hypothetical protein
LPGNSSKSKRKLETFLACNFLIDFQSNPNRAIGFDGLRSTWQPRFETCRYQEEMPKNPAMIKAGVAQVRCDPQVILTV